MSDLSVCVFQSTGERGELSCGWAFFKLTDDTGNPLPNRYKHIHLYKVDINSCSAHSLLLAIKANMPMSALFYMFTYLCNQPHIMQNICTYSNTSIYSYIYIVHTLTSNLFWFMCRTYELPVSGGTPYEKDIAVEASVTRTCKKTQQWSALFTMSGLFKMFLRRIFLLQYVICNIKYHVNQFLMIVQWCE